MLTLQGIPFQLDEETRDTAFFVSESDEEDTLKISLDVCFQENDFEGIAVTPYMIINSTSTTAKEVSGLIGQSFQVTDIAAADEREDTFYLFEHEPLVEYRLEILDISEEKAHIKCAGIAVMDGYAKPYKTAPFELDCWLPVITNVSDWDKYGL